MELFSLQPVYRTRAQVVEDSFVLLVTGGTIWGVCDSDFVQVRVERYMFRSQLTEEARVSSREFADQLGELLGEVNNKVG